ncbi:phosphopantetheine-binding protein [Pseudogemmobacter sonorensis]|uniref:phosphopantetheine-binding protein n=1 Tax=Pseudogemmobacter sonorensis TaxID=2989681 RepID=UPI003679E359
MSLTLERMRADIARMIHLDPEEIGDTDSLPDLGLDSLRLMRLAMEWEEAGLKADFSILAEHGTLGEWWAEISARGLAG